MLVNEIVRSVKRAIEGAVNNGQWQSYEGPNSKNLEAQIAGSLDQSYVQLASSGTAALEIVLRAAGIGTGDEVLLSGYDYPGNFWAIERVGARPVLVDTSLESWRLDVESLERAFQPTCKALVVSHLHGELQKVDELRVWCDHHKVLLFEDVCQSLGARWQGVPVGSFGHASILSFGGGKLLSCGRGGAWSTSDEALAVKARVAAGAGSGPYAMSELQAATVLAQWPWLHEINSRCRDFFKSLDQHLKAERCDWIFVPKSNIDETALYQCGWQLPEEVLDADRQQLLTALRSIPTGRTPETSELNEGTFEQLPFGVGFHGFHRRSSRRCRVLGSLDHVTAAADRTLVLHHRVVLQQQWSPQQLASWITRCIAGKV